VILSRRNEGVINDVDVYTAEQSTIIAESTTSDITELTFKTRKSTTSPVYVTTTTRKSPLPAMSSYCTHVALTGLALVVSALSQFVCQLLIRG